VAHLLPILTTALTLDEAPTDVHDWEGKETNVLVLNYTMACPLACDFCCYACHPGRKEKMQLSRALSLVDQAADLEVFSSVGFTGGEVMLFYDDILTIGERLREHTLPFTIATAGHWATSRNVARSMLEPLASRGLIRLNVSCDPSHSRFVPKDSVVHACIAASALHIPTYVVGTFYSPSESLESFVPELSQLEGVHLVDKYVAKVGRASKREISQATYGFDLVLEDLCCYRRVYHDLVVFYDGKAYPCCSTFNRASPGINVGNAFTEGLRTIWERVEGSLMFRVMKRQGFDELYRIVERMDPALFKLLPPASSTCGPCSLCNQIFKSAHIAARVQEVFARYEQERVEGAIDVMAEMLGESSLAALLQTIVAE